MILKLCHCGNPAIRWVCPKQNLNVWTWMAGRCSYHCVGNDSREDGYVELDESEIAVLVIMSL
jgi:hypothetical protein